MFYTVYKVTNNIDGKFYIGTHKTLNIDDGYMGSGKYLKRAINKHGIESFTKEILFVFDNAEDMFAKEAELVDDDFLMCNNTYNLKAGGKGGFDYINDNPHLFLTEKRLSALWSIEQRRERYKEKLLTDAEFRQSQLQHLKNAGKIAQEKYPEGIWKGRIHKEESKAKISAALSGKYTGDKNPHTGSYWIHNKHLKVSKKLFKGEQIPDGWEIGRKIKW